MNHINSSDGNVIVEFIGVTVSLLIPLAVIANASILVANAYLATEISARTAARAFVISNSDASGTRAASSAAGLAGQDFDSRNPGITTKIVCTKNPCLSPGGFVTVKATKDVKLNLPRIFGAHNIRVASEHTSVVDELRAP